MFAFAKIERNLYFSKIGYNDSYQLCLLGSTIDFWVVLWVSFLGVGFDFGVVYLYLWCGLFEIIGVLPPLYPSPKGADL